ncbi:MAG: DUF1330 domain-containing protein [Pseudomonadales bacterium]|nr:DUF1330 domain-containing protein [Pseudomonadales bacterium]
MSVYLIARITIRDRTEYAKYEAGFMEIFTGTGGEMLSVDEAPEVLEGAWACTRTVLARFPSEAAALGWYNSDAYQKLARHRFNASDGEVVLVKGMG